MNNFLQRTLTGIAFVIVMVGAIVLHPMAFGVLFWMITILGQLEFYKLVRSESIKPNLFTGLAGGAIAYGIVFLHSNQLWPDDLLMISWLIIPLVVIAELFTISSHPFTNIAYTLLGILYIALPFSLLNFYFSPTKVPEETDFALLLGYFIILWLNDTGAYLVGRATGKHPLFKRISPKKTWEGVAGGLVIGLLAAWGLSTIFTQLSLPEWIIMAVLIIIFSTFGDLIESMLKRSVQVKDSGTLLPGHGGILDRFDGVLLSAPAVYIYLYVVFN